MRAVTKDGAFGIQIHAASPKSGYDRRFFTFQLLIHGRLVGDDDLAIAYRAIAELSQLPTLDDPRVRDALGDPKAAIDAILTGEACNRALFGYCASLDHWLTVAYVLGDKVVWIADRYRGAQRAGRPAVAMVPRSDYDSVVAEVRNYWARQSGSE